MNAKITCCLHHGSLKCMVKDCVNLAKINIDFDPVRDFDGLGNLQLCQEHYNCLMNIMHCVKEDSKIRNIENEQRQ